MTLPNEVIAALTVAIIVQTGALVYWAGKVTTTLNAHHERITKLEDSGSRTAIETAARLDAHVDADAQPRRRRTDRQDYED